MLNKNNKWSEKESVMKYTCLQFEMESGKDSSLLLEASRIFKLCSNPIESGNASKIFDARLSSSRFSNPDIESGMTCSPHTGHPNIGTTYTSQHIKGYKARDQYIFEMLLVKPKPWKQAKSKSTRKIK